MSTATSSPVLADVGIPPNHLTNEEAEDIAARIPWRSADLAPWLRTIYVRAVDSGRPWVETYLTPTERTAIRNAIEETDSKGVC